MVSSIIMMLFRIKEQNCGEGVSDLAGLESSYSELAQNKIDVPT